MCWALVCTQLHRCRHIVAAKATDEEAPKTKRTRRTKKAKAADPIEHTEPADPIEAIGQTEQPDGFGAADEARPPSSFQPGSNAASGAAEWQDNEGDARLDQSNGTAVYNSVEEKLERNMMEAVDAEFQATRDIEDLNDEEALFMQ